MNRFILQVSLRELNRWCLEEFDFGLDAYSCPKEFLRAMIDLTPRELLLHVAHLLIEKKSNPQDYVLSLRTEGSEATTSSVPPPISICQEKSKAPLSQT